MKTYLIHSIKALTATALISGGIALAAPAYAISAQSDQITTKIDIRDLETDYGVAKVYEALERRAESACRTPGMKSISSRNAEEVCAEDLLVDFIQDVDDGRLTSYHEKMQN